VAQASDDAARDQGHVFWNGNAKAANQKHHENGQIAVFGEDGHQKLKNFHDPEGSGGPAIPVAKCTEATDSAPV
jgi:hypothetical protein